MRVSKLGATKTILDKILAQKEQEVVTAKQLLTLEEIENQIKGFPSPRPFIGSLRSVISNGEPAVIAEIKKASPSKGLIRSDFNPSEHAKDYEANGATCLSVLTDVEYFMGADDYLSEVKQASSLPVLRKEFIIDPYQVAQSKLLGADCILLIVAALSHSQLHELAAYANQIAIDILVEVHDRDELDRAIELDNDLIGINNRNLHNFETSLKTTLELKRYIPSDKVVVTESGINSVEDVEMMNSNGVFGFLVGETFMRASRPGEKLKELFFEHE